MKHKGDQLKDWLDKGWVRLVHTDLHPLSVIGEDELQGRDVLVLLGPRNRFGAEYFQVFVAKKGSGAVTGQAMVGLHSAGAQPAHNWVEIICFGDVPLQISPQENRCATKDSLCLHLLRRVAGVIPAGGRLMVEYDSPGQRETARGLALGIPPVATQLGFLMYLVGCRAGFRDWYFAEGGSEGPRKLQGSKPLDRKHAVRAAHELASELVEFLARPIDTANMDIQQPARERAAWILSTVEIQEINLKRRIDKVLGANSARGQRD